MIYQILSTNNCKLTWSSYNIPRGIVFYALMIVGYLHVVNVLLHKSNGGKSEKLNPPMYTLTPLHTWTIKLQQMMEQIMILNRDNSRREKHLWLEIKLNHMQDKTIFFFYISCILPIFLYGSESWSMIDKQARRQHFIQSL